MAKEVIMKCPRCGTIVRGKYGFFNKDFNCSQCNKRIEPPRDAYEAVACSGCGNTVLFDTRVGKATVCPICSKSLEENSIMDTEVNCPYCTVRHVVKINAVSHVCGVCGGEFDVKHAMAMKDAKENAVASVIAAPYENEAVIWEHPLDRFAYSSHVVVREGYTALILRDGRCAGASKPGKYVLSDTMRTVEEQLKHALSNPDSEVSVKVFFVRNQIDKQFSWTEQKQPVTDKEGNIVGSLGIGGSVSLTVTDAKKFAEFVGYKTMTADQLISVENTQRSKLWAEVSAKCFESAHRVFVSAVLNSGYAYKALNANKLMFKKPIRDMVDQELSAIGLSTSLFELSFVTFEEDDSVKTTRIKETLENENFKNIRRYVQREFAWESPAITIHMKGDMTLSSELVFGGSLKFRINDSVFFRNPEVENWIENGISEYEIADYCARLAKVATSNVLQDILQPMIDDTDADIRDLAIYYKYIRENIQRALADYFAKDGLSIDLFSMEEKSRKQSVALNAKGEAEVHKSQAQIEQDLYAFTQKQRVERDAIDGKTKLELDRNALDLQKGMTQHAGERAADKIDNMYIDESITTAVDDIRRAREKKYKDWDRQDKEDAISYAHKERIDGYTRADEIAEKEYQVNRNVYTRTSGMDALKHEAELTGYKYAGDIRQATHEAEMTDYRNKKESDAARHASAMQSIGYETEQKMELHYQNQQEIENRAKELYTKWEAEANRETAELQHQIAMRDIGWASDRSLTRDKTALQHELEQSAAENDRAINAILRKIAESDLELTEKKDAYSRLLRNQATEDALRKMDQEAALKNTINYNEAHMRNTLKKEDQDLAFTGERNKLSLQRELNEIVFANEHLKNTLTREEKELIDEMTRREAERRESEKAADFSRAMLVKEKDTAHEMEILKLEYEAYRKTSELEQELKNKNLEIEKLKVLLEHQEAMGERDIRKLGMEQDSALALTKAEYDYKNRHDQAEYDYRSRHDQAEYGYLTEKVRSEYGYLAEHERSERAEQERREAEERKASEKQEHERLELEKIYMQRADDLLSKMLSIQAAIKNHSLDNENTAINANADVQIARANAQASISENYANKKIAEMERLMKQMSRSIDNLNESVKKVNKKVSDKESKPYPDYGWNYGGQSGSQNPPPVAPYGVQGRRNQYTQPGTSNCLHCGQPVSQYASICPKCNKKIR